MDTRNLLITQGIVNPVRFPHLSTAFLAGNRKGNFHKRIKNWFCSQWDRSMGTSASFAFYAHKDGCNKNNATKLPENKIGRGFRRKRKKPVFPYMNTVFPFREKQALSLPSGREWNGGKYLRTHYTIIQLRDTASIACICLFFVKRKRQFRRLSHMWAQTTVSL